MVIEVEILKAKHGDCILLTHSDKVTTFNVLIDGGNSQTFRYGPRGRDKGDLCKRLEEIKGLGQKINLAILTHIDDDHIGGMLKAFEHDGYLKEMLECIWFYSSKTITNHFNRADIPGNDPILDTGSLLTGVGQGKTLDQLVNDLGCQRVPVLLAGQIFTHGPFTFKVLSPTEKNLRDLLCKWPSESDDNFTSAGKNDHDELFENLIKDDVFIEDQSITNGSSIAFIVEVEGKQMLFLGDAFDSVIVKSLSDLGYSETHKLNIDLVKISHHGSKYNTSSNFLRMIATNKYIISTDGSKHGLPDKKSIARILSSNDTGLVYFNYDNVIKSITKQPENPDLIARLVFLNKKITF